MLTAEQIAVLRDRALQITDPINDFLLDDIARRIAGASQLTSTAAYEVWRAQQLGLSRWKIKKRLRELLGVNRRMLKELLTQSAEVGYNFDIRQFSGRAVPFRKNVVIQQIVAAAVELAQDDFTNLTKTIGMVDPYGNALPLHDAYRSCTDYAFKQVITGAADYNTAIRQATRNLAAKGVRVIDYESGVHTSLEAAVRRNIMGGLGLMQEQITKRNHDDFGCDGWEISAHAASAPDHEPIQGKQYSDAEYEVLNNSLVRRIGTLNCGHAAFPIILGVSTPQYTPEELEKFRTDNEKGVTVYGRHYTMYEATQMQRKLERSIRAQKRRILVAEASGDEDTLKTARTRLQMLRQEYKGFSSAAGLRTQQERLEVSGFWPKQTERWSKKTKESAPPLLDANGKPKEEEHEAGQGIKGRSDVTEEYIRTATPGQGTVTFEDCYRIKGHQNEIKMAHWLLDTFGGDIKLLAESKVQGDKTPDFLWNGHCWELKGVTSKNSIDRAVRDGSKQIQSIPGGIILDISESNLSIDEIEEVIGQRIPRIAIDSVDALLVSKEQLTKVVRYKK